MPLTAPWELALIDEIDLHLHPRWQRTVVDDLRRAFPQVQFIATTHSPFILQSLPAHAVIDLSDAMAQTPTGQIQRARGDRLSPGEHRGHRRASNGRRESTLVKNKP